MRVIYFDHAATTPIDPRVFQAMVPFLTDTYGNASSVHNLGRRARVTVEACRERIAAHLGAVPSEIIFTSGGTESNNTALKGVPRAGKNHVVTSAAEHEATLRPAESLRKLGRPVTILKPNRFGAIDLQELKDALTEGTGLVSLMHTNNETGAINPVTQIADLCRTKGIPFHSDAVQAAGLFELNVDALGVDLLSISGHKLYGPKGIGILYVRSGIFFTPLVEGGSQERRRRAGTENVAAIVGLAEAFDLAMREREERWNHVAKLRARLYETLRQALGDAFVCNTPLEDGLSSPHILNIAFPPVEGRPVDGEMLILNLDVEGVMVSAGSACTSGALEPSHVLLAAGLDRTTASASVRFSLGKDNTEQDVDEAVERLVRVYKRLTR